MVEAFVAGGFGMYPTLIAGLALLAACVRYASRPESRYVPLMLCLGLFTLFAGALGFVTGVMNVLKIFEQADVEPRVLLVGGREAAFNLVLALLMTTLAALVASVGAWRLSQRAPAATV